MNISLCLYIRTLSINKLGLSCAKLRASLNFFGFDEILIYFNWLTYFEFANLAYELNFGALLLLLWKVWFGLFCSVWNTWFCRLGLVDLASFSLIKVLFIFNAIFIFEFLFIIQFIFISKIVFLFKVVFQFEVLIIFNVIFIFEVISIYMCGFPQPQQKFSLNLKIAILYSLSFYPVKETFWNLLCILFGCYTGTRLSLAIILVRLYY